MHSISHRIQSLIIVIVIFVLLPNCTFLPDVSEVRLSENSITLKVGQTRTITASVVPAAAEYERVTWSSSNRSVADVKEGKITAYNVGEASITASTEGVTSLPCQVIVQAIPVNGVKLDKTAVTILEGESLMLKATVLPSDATNSAVFWSSNDESIARVSSDGTVTAITEGIANITVKAQDGGASAYCTVTVNAAEYVNFPDANFRKFMLDNFDQNKNGKISVSEAKKVNVIKMDSSGEIESLQGIEYCENLTILDVHHPVSVTFGTGWYEVKNLGNIKIIDLSKNTKLQHLDCSGNQLTLLDLSKNTALTKLDCSYNKLSSLDLSKNPLLKTLNCNFNQLTKLDVWWNTTLESLSCVYNMISSLDVSKNAILKELYCHNNQLSAIDVSLNVALQYLVCGSNKISSLNVTNNENLYSLNCGSNQLTSLDVTNNKLLHELVCYSNMISNLGVTKNTYLSSLSCDSNLLTSLDVSKNTWLEDLSCANNELTSLDVTNNTKLTRIYCMNNQLTKLDVSKNAWLETLICSSNRLTTLDVTNNRALVVLWCSSNRLASLNVTNPELKQLFCYDNELSTLDVSKNTKLESLDCAPMPSLTTLYISSGQSIPNVTSSRSTSFIPSQTSIVVKDQ